MKHAAFTRANDIHHSKLLGSQLFGKDYKLTSKVKSLLGSILCMRRKFRCTVNASLAKIKNPLDCFSGYKVNVINLLQE